MSVNEPPRNPTPRSAMLFVVGVTLTTCRGSTGSAGFETTPSGPLSQVPDEIIQRQLGHFDKADAAYGAGVRAALKARGRNVD